MNFKIGKATAVKMKLTISIPDILELFIYLFVYLFIYSFIYLFITY